MKQQTFFKSRKKDFGGSNLRHHPKECRPITTKQAMHLVLRSDMAKGEMSLRAPRHRKKVQDIVYDQAKKQGVRIYEYANAVNHLHIICRGRRRRSFITFLRVISGLIARLVLQAERGKPSG